MLNRAAEASSPSFTIGEAALLSSVSSISSAMASSRLRSTSSRTGSMSVARAHALSPDPDVRRGVDQRPRVPAAPPWSCPPARRWPGPPPARRAGSRARSYTAVRTKPAGAKYARRSPTRASSAAPRGGAGGRTTGRGRAKRCTARKLTNSTGCCAPRVAVHALVGRVEAAQRVRDAAGGERKGDRHLELVRLPDVAHVGGVGGGDGSGLHALLGHPRPSRGVQLAEAAVDGGEVDLVGPARERARVLVLDGRGEEPEGGQHARAPRAPAPRPSPSPRRGRRRAPGPPRRARRGRTGADRSRA